MSRPHIPLSNASSAASRPPSHGSGPGWFAIPCLYDFFHHCSMPVYPDAIQDGVMTDLGTLPYPLNFSSAAADINEMGQVTGMSCDSSGSVCHGFIWENGVMTDLNNLMLPPGSPQVAGCCGINDRGEIVVDLFDPSTGNTTAYLTVPCDDAHASYEACADSAASVPAAAQAVSKRTNVILPESTRQHLQKRGFGHFAGGSVKPQ